MWYSTLKSRSSPSIFSFLPACYFIQQDKQEFPLFLFPLTCFPSLRPLSSVKKSLNRDLPSPLLNPQSGRIRSVVGVVSFFIFWGGRLLAPLRTERGISLAERKQKIKSVSTCLDWKFSPNAHALKQSIRTTLLILTKSGAESGYTLQFRSWFTQIMIGNSF